MIESYLRVLERGLQLAADETREILMEARASLQDIAGRLERTGMSPDEAEREAVARFGSAKVLAMALRRSHGYFPLPLRVLSIALFVFGLVGLVLGALMAPSFFQTASHVPSFEAPWVIVATAVQLGVIALSLTAGGAGLWKGRRGRVGASVRVSIYLGVLVDVLFILFLGSSLSPNNLRAQPSTYGNADVHPSIPNLALLQEAGRVGRPGRTQPASPVRVENVAVDAGTTYVSYDVREPGHAEQVFPRLHDALGQEYPLRSGVVSYSVLGGFYSLLPWAWASTPHGVAIFNAVPPNTTALTLDFYSVEGTDKPSESLWDPYYFLANRLYDISTATLRTRYGPYVAPALLETVHVPLHLRALSELRIVHPQQEAALKGIDVGIDTVTNSSVGAQIAYVITSSPGTQVDDPGYPVISDSGGRTIPYTLRIDDSFHGRTAITPPGYNFYPFQAPLPDGKIHYQCGIVLPPQRSGTRLLLSFPSLDPSGLPPVRGPWRLWVTMP